MEYSCLFIYSFTHSFTRVQATLFGQSLPHTQKSLICISSQPNPKHLVIITKGSETLTGEMDPVYNIFICGKQAHLAPSYRCLLKKVI